MRLNSTLCLNRLNSARFGVLATVDPDRGTHLVPVVFAVAGDELVVPIDSVSVSLLASVILISAPFLTVLPVYQLKVSPTPDVPD